MGRTAKKAKKRGRTASVPEDEKTLGPMTVRTSGQHLDEAVCKRDHSKVAYLLKLGADPNRTTGEYNLTLLCMAAIKKDVHIATLLLEKEADPHYRHPKERYNLTLFTDRMPLCIASSEGDKCMVELLVSKGADINIQDFRGDTPLHYAVRKRNFIMMKKLVRMGANVNVKNAYGRTPIKEAEEWCPGDARLPKRLRESPVPLVDLSEADRNSSFYSTVETKDEDSALTQETGDPEVAGLLDREMESPVPLVDSSEPERDSSFSPTGKYTEESESEDSGWTQENEDSEVMESLDRGMESLVSSADSSEADRDYSFTPTGEYTEESESEDNTWTQEIEDPEGLPDRGMESPVPSAVSSKADGNFTCSIVVSEGEDSSWTQETKDTNARDKDTCDRLQKAVLQQIPPLTSLRALDAGTPTNLEEFSPEEDTPAECSQEKASPGPDCVMEEADQQLDSVASFYSADADTPHKQLLEDSFTEDKPARLIEQEASSGTAFLRKEAVQPLPPLLTSLHASDADPPLHLFPERSSTEEDTSAGLIKQGSDDVLWYDFLLKASSTEENTSAGLCKQEAMHKQGTSPGTECLKEEVVQRQLPPLTSLNTGDDDTWYHLLPKESSTEEDTSAGLQAGSNAQAGNIFRC